MLVYLEVGAGVLGEVVQAGQGGDWVNVAVGHEPRDALHQLGKVELKGIDGGLGEASGLHLGDECIKRL